MLHMSPIHLAGFNEFNIWPDNIHLGTDRQHKPEQNL